MNKQCMEQKLTDTRPSKPENISYGSQMVVRFYWNTDKLRAG